MGRDWSSDQCDWKGNHVSRRAFLADLSCRRKTRKEHCSLVSVWGLLPPVWPATVGAWGGSNSSEGREVLSSCRPGWDPLWEGPECALCPGTLQETASQGKGCPELGATAVLPVTLACGPDTLQTLQSPTSVLTSGDSNHLKTFMLKVIKYNNYIYVIFLPVEICQALQAKTDVWGCAVVCASCERSYFSVQREHR